ncbi:hypothetical protein GCM10022216_13350 [Sphingobacterium kyonggiense]|uniref:Lipoprotein n=1 Tax=Sphingobacterium kyonggiense TaxID=714075 RepID=A0ABP7YK92_9SPHI
MKTKIYLKTALAIALLVVSASCKDKNKNEVKPKASSVTYRISSPTANIALTSLIVTDSKGKDSTITKDLNKLPKSVTIIRKAPKKGETLSIKTKVDKPASVRLEILINGKVVKDSKAIEIKDIKNEAKTNHKL